MSTNLSTYTETRNLAGKLEERFVYSLFLFIKNARLVDAANATFKMHATMLVEAFQALADRFGEVTLKIHEGRYFVNDRLVRFDDQGGAGAFKVTREWHELGLGGVYIPAGISGDEVIRLVVFLSIQRVARTTSQRLLESFREAQFVGVRLYSTQEAVPEASISLDEQRLYYRTVARSTFSRAMHVVQDALSAAKQDKEISVGKTRRVVHSLIDHVVRDEASLLELAAIKNHDDYTYAHSTNVCIYSLTVGVRINMDRPRLAQLGFAALFHDIGKVKLPKDLINKPDAFDENDWVQMQRHPLLGAKTILRNMKLDTHTARAARGAFEHHINNDFTGYPLLRHAKRPPTLFSKIIAITDSFDALSSGRVYLRKQLTPDAVLKKMLYQMAVKFDPFLMRVFTEIIGAYPVGSLVLLSNEQLALVVTHGEAHHSRPCVKVIGDKQGLFDSARWIDLAAPEHADLNIQRQVDPVRYGLDIKALILCD